MAKLIYAVITSLDGYVADADGAFDWAAPDEEVHAFVNDLERPIGTHLFGRRMFEVLSAWESDDILAGDPPSVIGTTRRSGGPPTRSCTPPRSSRSRAPERGSSGPSTPTRSAA